ncbi:ExbD/TolR family protein [Shewanella intestini]|uniref:Biopolymer transporter ExbD n=1 Tax=Shewanella intestini TaxID=2017544 RepID=A0ABS5HYR1_9GAMM|nr:MULTISPECIES: biopolymer transporter ExbD [Shewanella]MBR9726909.1 biopolymer transporter ExbD [Shewanella intestini]MRG34525.1 biopolymer transporter ExbD [Shewanella sp. XMDDZSB0408]
MLSDRFRQEKEPEINMTPMLDVVFILLIFFIVSTNFIQQSAVEINRPQSNTARAVDGTPIIITLDTTGRLYLEKEEIDIYYLPEKLRQMAIQMPKAKLLILADTDCPTGVTIKVLDIAKQAGIEFSSVATEKE